MTTFAQMQAQGVAFLKAQVGKGYTEVPGQNLGPDKWDCEGLARAVYLPFGVDIGFGSRAQCENSKAQLQPSDPGRCSTNCFSLVQILRSGTPASTSVPSFLVAPT